MMKFYLLTVVAVFALGAAALQSVPAINPPDELERLRMELEAERLFLGPNYHIGDSFFVEGTIIETGQGWLKIDQHLDSPPRPVDPVINTHQHTVVQLRTVDDNHVLAAVEYRPVDMLEPGTDVVILYLPGKKMAKSIIVFQNK